MIAGFAEGAKERSKERPFPFVETAWKIEIKVVS
jgi:hypothetical protein